MSGHVETGNAGTDLGKHVVKELEVHVRGLPGRLGGTRMHTYLAPIFLEAWLASKHAHLLGEQQLDALQGPENLRQLVL